MSTDEFAPLTPEELATEGVTALPDKEVVSILDLAADIDLAIDGAAPIDLAVALNANVVAPIDAAVSRQPAHQRLHLPGAGRPGCHGHPERRRGRDRDRPPGQHDRPVRHRHRRHGATPADGTADATPADGRVMPSRHCWRPPMPLVPTPPTPPPRGPVDGSVVVDSTGHIIGTLDSATGNVVDSAGNILGTLNETTGLVVDSAGNLVGTVTDLVDGALGRRIRRQGPSVSSTQSTGNVRRRLRQRGRNARPADRRSPQHGGRRARHVTDFVDGTTRARLRRQRGRHPRRCDRQRRRLRRQRDRCARPAHRPGPRRRRQPRRHGRRDRSTTSPTPSASSTPATCSRATCSTSTSTSTWTPTWQRRSTAPSRPTPTSRRRSTRPWPPTSCPTTPSRPRLAQQDAIITSTITGNAEATSDQVSGIDQASDRAARHRHRVGGRPGIRRSATSLRPAPATDAGRPALQEPAPADATTDPSTDGTDAAVTTLVDAPTRVDGVQLIGEMVGSGYRTPPALVRRGDGQVLQLTPLLYLVLDAADGRRSCAEIADVVSHALGRSVTEDDVATLGRPATCGRSACSSWPTARSRSSSGRTRCWASSPGSPSPTPGPPAG